MPRKFFRKYLPDPDAVRATWLGRKFGAWLGHPTLWHLNRRSVPGALAIGLFSGLVPGPFQMLCAFILCLSFRKNIPVALATTLYTNPLTIVPLYLLAYWIGTLLLGMEHVAPKITEFSWAVLAELGKPLALGLVALALGLALAGYLAAHAAWRLYVLLSWRKRRRR